MGDDAELIRTDGARGEEAIDSDVCATAKATRVATPLCEEAGEVALEGGGVEECLWGGRREGVRACGPHMQHARDAGEVLIIHAACLGCEGCLCMQHACMGCGWCRADAR